MSNTAIEMQEELQEKCTAHEYELRCGYLNKGFECEKKFEWGCSDCPMNFDVDWGKANKYELSMRQMQILKFRAKGYSNKQIAYALGISTTTVKNHTSGKKSYKGMDGIYTKMGVSNSNEAIAVAFREGILK